MGGTVSNARSEDLEKSSQQRQHKGATAAKLDSNDMNILHHPEPQKGVLASLSSVFIGGARIQREKMSSSVPNDDESRSCGINRSAKYFISRGIDAYYDVDNHAKESRLRSPPPMVLLNEKLVGPLPSQRMQTQNTVFQRRSLRQLSSVSHSVSSAETMMSRRSIVVNELHDSAKNSLSYGDVVKEYDMFGREKKSDEDILPMSWSNNNDTSTQVAWARK